MRLKHGLTQYSRRFQAYPVWGLVSVPSLAWWERGMPGLSAAVDSLTKEVQTSNGYLRTIAEKAEKGGVALFS